MIKKITIEVIPHLDQRYNTVGDWQFERDSKGSPTELNVKVSDLDDENYHILIGLHEAIEALLCHKKGVKEADVDKFDLTWKPTLVHWNSTAVWSEPGEDYHAPYYEEHQLAVGIERILASRMWVNWGRYEAQVDELIKDSEVYFAQKAKPSDFDDDIPF